jgi:recombination protein RecA
MYGEGISKVGEIIDIGSELNVIQKSGSWFSYEGNKLGQGRDSVKELLLDNPEMMEEIETKIRAKIAGLKVVVTEDAIALDEEELEEEIIEKPAKAAKPEKVK